MTLIRSMRAKKNPSKPVICKKKCTRKQELENNSGDRKKVHPTGGVRKAAHSHRLFNMTQVFRELLGQGRFSEKAM